MPTRGENITRLTVLVEELTDKLPAPDNVSEIKEGLLDRLHHLVDTLS